MGQSEEFRKPIGAILYFLLILHLEINDKNWEMCIKTRHIKAGSQILKTGRKILNTSSKLIKAERTSDANIVTIKRQKYPIKSEIMPALIQGSFMHVNMQ